MPCVRSTQLNYRFDHLQIQYFRSDPILYDKRKLQSDSNGFYPRGYKMPKVAIGPKNSIYRYTTTVNIAVKI